MTALQLIGGWAAGAIVTAIGLKVVIKPANADGWLVVALMAALWPATLIALLLLRTPEEGQ